MKSKQLALPNKVKRNRAFTQALSRAKSFAKDPKALRDLFHEAMRKTGSIPKKPFAELWAYLQAMLRLIRAYYRGQYRAISVTNLVMIVGAII